MTAAQEKHSRWKGYQMKAAIITVAIVAYVVMGLFCAIVYGANDTSGKTGPVGVREWTKTALAGVFWPAYLVWLRVR